MCMRFCSYSGVGKYSGFGGMMPCLLVNNGPVRLLTVGRGSSVGIATDYGLDGPGSNPDGDEIFRPSTKPPVQWVPGLSRG